MTVSTSTNEHSRLFLDSCTVVVIGIIFVAPYVMTLGRFPGKYLIADVAITLLMVARFGRGSIRRLGFAIPYRQGAAALFAFSIWVFLANAIVNIIATDVGIEIVHRTPLFSLSQVLHQEIVLHGLLLGSLLVRHRAPIALAILLAVFFCGLHAALVWSTTGIFLPTTSLASLFVFGFATNLWFVRSGNIAFSFAAHAAWNLVRFGEGYRLNNESIGMAQSLVEIEGSLWALGAGIVLLGIATVTPVEKLNRRHC